ncbi:VirB8/TrbF family protein [Vibrio harveyi]|uniref:VirB8/TrbF family protein n=1 Tax=Vibrio harveyi TaxID=669 RepID=UPI001B836763|nr:type IV secretion system protein [Vibrio parahaemolyticus]
MSNPESPLDYSILYQRARDEWDERLGSIVKQAHNWKMCAFFSMFVSAIAVGSAGYIGAQSKIEPYVIGVKNGEEVIGVASVSKLPTSQLEALKVSDLERFVEDIRGVLLDVEAQDKAVRRAYARLLPNSPAQTQITNAFKKENPFERASRELVKIDIQSTLPLSDNTWQTEWVETITDRQGNVLDTPRFKATLTTQTIQPKNKAEMTQNPLGLWIVTFNDVQIN